MIISVASGKGGTGKTTIAINLALALGKNNKVQFLDCDVEEPNAHLFLKPEIKETKPVNLPVPKVDEAKCSFCGKCSKICEYNALAVLKDKVLVFTELCHGCGGCMILCPEEAISEAQREIGVIEKGFILRSSPTTEKGQQNGIDFIHGCLRIGEALAPPLIRAVKKEITNLPAGKAGSTLTIIDVAPGTSCPVVAALKDSDYTILVTEPTPFGLNDLILAVETLRKLFIPFGVVINRSDIGDDKVDKYCNDNKIPILIRIPFDPAIARAYSQGIPMVKAIPEYEDKFIKLYEEIQQKIKNR